MNALLRFRRDLVCKRLEMGGTSLWVIQDPMTKELRYVSETDFNVLDLVNGQRTVQQIFHECSRRFTDRFISAESLIQFLAAAKRKRLLIETGTEIISFPGAQSLEDVHDTPRVSPWLRLMAFRMPGIQPDKCFALFDSWLRQLCRPWVAAIYSWLLIVGLLITVINWSQITDQIALAIANRGTHTAVQLLLVVSLVKIIHELAHAIACYLFAGSCREVGVMFLLGVPCLYCDVSNAWLVQERWKRLLISAAGILAELGIAATATILWALSADAIVREWCLVVMVVCSVSTVVVNANPLMRFDGYFLLSDLIAIPNLSSQAKTALQQVIRRVLWSEPYPISNEVDGRQRLCLAAYSGLSIAYRVAVMLVIGLLVYRFSFDSGFAVLGALTVVAFAATTLIPEIRPLLVPTNPSVGTWFTHPGLPMRLLCVALLSLALIWPWPQSVVAPMTVRPFESQEVFAPVSGRLRSSVQHGTMVSKNDPIVHLENWDLRLQLSEVTSRYQSIVTQRNTLNSQRVSGDVVSAQLLTLTTSAEATKEKASLLQQELNRLTVPSPLMGMVFPGQLRRAQVAQNNDYESWTGLPIDSANEGAWIEAGTLLCTIGDPVSREAILYVNQKEIPLVEIGQRVKLLIPSRVGDPWRGEIIEIGVVPLNECPTALATSGLIVVNSSTSLDKPKPEETLYQVRVKMESPDDAIPNGTIGKARIYVGSSSTISRIWRAFSQSFRW